MKLNDLIHEATCDKIENLILQATDHLMGTKLGPGVQNNIQYAIIDKLQNDGWTRNWKMGFRTLVDEPDKVDIEMELTSPMPYDGCMSSVIKAYVKYE